MNIEDLLSLYMEMEFGSQGCHLLKSLVNEALDNGEWHDGFEVAVKTGELDYRECAELFESVRKAYPHIVFNASTVKALIELHLPQAALTSIRWLIADDGSLVITDSLRVARFLNDELVWVTKRISWDGINLTKIVNNEIVGQWLSPIVSQNEWKPLRLSLHDGTLLEGQEITF